MKHKFSVSSHVCIVPTLELSQVSMNHGEADVNLGHQLLKGTSCPRFEHKWTVRSDSRIKPPVSEELKY